jgi:hypothetical protein
MHGRVFQTHVFSAFLPHHVAGVREEKKIACWQVEEEEREADRRKTMRDVFVELDQFVEGKHVALHTNYI